MSDYVIKEYEIGFEKQHRNIDSQIIKDWAWPFEGFTDIYESSDFDPESVLSCFKGNKMIGYIASIFMAEGPAINKIEGMGVYMDIPRVLAEYEEVADLLMENFLDVIKTKGVKLIRTRANTMRKNSIPLVKKWGFVPHPDFKLGYKIYYTYDLSKGKINLPTDDLQVFDLDRDLDDCAKGPSKHFKTPIKNVKKWITETNARMDLVSHYVIRKNNELVGYCNAYPNPLVKDIVATYYIEAKNNHYMKQLIVKTINDCIDKKYRLFLIDLIGYLLPFKKLVESLNFENACTWEILEKKLQ
ncbi:MAG: hypothetical protein EAX89_17220 [Candidatus Lokiarchaeota archaeon]|nr:hypothetical protein [Candidatus Lokiarchaeota archaeon]